MPKPLVIVESPAKAKTIAGILGGDFMVESSIGHIRDLPRNAADVPEQYRGLPWARDGVDCDNDFKPLYIVPKEKKDQVRKLKALLKQASEVYLATDEDREGESISWHLQEVLSRQVPIRRMVFHEITRPAIERAVTEWRDLDLPLVDAQATRRIADRPYRSQPSPPFMTSTLQQEAGRKLRFSSARTMQVAQRLYENGFITYMRTDSTTLSEQALSAARSQASQLYGAEYVPAQPRQYVKKVKNAQEAHEAIRPAGETFRTPDSVSRALNGDELRLYD